MRVAFIGPPLSGKSTIFAAIAETSGSHVDMSRPDQAHLVVVKVPDERVDWLTEYYQPKKTTFAELEFIDLPGLDLTDEAGRSRAKAHWSAMRQSDMLAIVVRDFEGGTAPEYRGRIDPAGDVEELLAEMLFADLEQVTARMAKLEAAMRKPSVQRDEQARELELMKRLGEALESDQSIADAIANETEAKLARSFGFLSQKPLLAVRNCSEDVAGEAGPQSLGPLPCLSISGEIEEEIAELSPEDRAEFLRDIGVDSPARDRLIRACYERVNLVSFLTAGEPECRAWSIPAGTDAVTAAGTIHSDIARGFIRAETVAYDDLHAAGDMKAAKAAGKVRLEGKDYIVADGDVIYFRFNT